MSILTKVLRAGEGKKLKALTTLVPDINAFEREIEALSDDDLQHKTVEFRERLDRPVRGPTATSVDDALNDLLLEAFAVTREAARRVIGQRHYDVQLMGGAALHFGWIAEMKTGEGKTLVSTLPVYLNGLSGRGVHLITVNDYLARRDAEWMGQIHRWLGLTVGIVLPMYDRPEMKRRPTAADVTYGTNNEFGFDYLRDNMAMSQRADGAAGPRLRHRRRGRLDPHRRGPHPAHHQRPGAGRGRPLLQVRQHRPHPRARRGLRGRRGEAHRRPPRGGHRARSSGPSASRTSTTSCRPTTSTSSRPPCGPRSCTSATSTTWSSTARSRSSTSSPAASSRAGAGRRACTRRSRPRSGCGSSTRTRPSPPSPSRTTSACTRSWRA